MTFYRFVQIVVRRVLSFRYHITVVDAHKLPVKTDKGRGFLLVSNHQTYGDPLFIGLGFHRQVSFMAKEELFHNPVLRCILKLLGAFPVSRGTGDQSAMHRAAEVVENGGVLGIFPEGTRSKDGSLGRAKSGAVVIAAKTRGDIYPVGIYYGKKRLIRRQLTISYGDVIKNSEVEVSSELVRAELKEASKKIMDSIAALLEKGKSLDNKK